MGGNSLDNGLDNAIDFFKVPEAAIQNLEGTEEIVPGPCCQLKVIQNLITDLTEVCTKRYLEYLLFQDGGCARARVKDAMSVEGSSRRWDLDSAHVRRAAHRAKQHAVRRPEGSVDERDAEGDAGEGCAEIWPAYMCRAAGYWERNERLEDVAGEGRVEVCGRTAERATGGVVDTLLECELEVAQLGQDERDDIERDRRTAIGSIWYAGWVLEVLRKERNWIGNHSSARHSWRMLGKGGRMRRSMGHVSRCIRIDDNTGGWTSEREYAEETTFKLL
ncbi:hypothetical protein C8F01DRAFT_1092096 [Mycena amicta]|nr:hypothetical protein C8F01DRAFT_1092096 [Mycena amicta]